MEILEVVGLILAVISLIVAITSIVLAFFSMDRAKKDAEKSKDFYDRAMQFHDQTKQLLTEIGMNSAQIKNDIGNIDGQTKFTLQQIENQATKIGVTLDSSQTTLIDTISKIALVNSKQNEKFQIGNQELMTQMIIENLKQHSSSKSSIKMLEKKDSTNLNNFEE